MPDARRRRDTLAPGIIAVLWLGGAIVLAVAAHRAAGELIFAPRFASSDAGEVVRAYYTARAGGLPGAGAGGPKAAARAEHGAPAH